MLLSLGCPVNDIVTFGKLLDEFGNLLWWILQIVVDRHDNLMFGCSDAAQQGVMLAIIAHQIDAANPSMLGSKLGDRLPATIFTPIIDKDKFVIFAQNAQDS